MRPFLLFLAGWKRGPATLRGKRRQGVGAWWDGDAVLHVY